MWNLDVSSCHWNTPKHGMTFPVLKECQYSYHIETSVNFPSRWRFKNFFFSFSEQFYVHSNTEGKVQRFLVPPYSPPCRASPPSASPRTGRLLQPVNLHWHIIIVQVQSLSWGSLLVLYILWVWTNVPGHVLTLRVSRGVRSSPRKSSVLHLVILPSLWPPGSRWSVHCPCHLAFFRMS